ncbi:hypothetical protein EVAR_84763_1 [Eumeta japonica]|uniref:Kazal-like domain-containing protein n=1 Tax=Eumeta variegata TaxID=151549 RepID=A0A4C1U9F6_EUMVA|nr:hypothetical protein EVAR_84763_1 [Eumeta japonica]
MSHRERYAISHSTMIEQYNHDGGHAFQKEYDFGHGHHTQQNGQYPYHHYHHGYHPHGYPHGHFPQGYHPHGHYSYDRWQNHKQGQGHDSFHNPHQNGQYDNHKQTHDFSSGQLPQKNEYHHKQEEKQDFGFGYYPQFEEGGHHDYHSNQQKPNEKYPELNEKNDTDSGYYPQYHLQNHKLEGSPNFDSNQKEYPKTEEKYEPDADQTPQNNDEVTTERQEEDVSIPDIQSGLNPVEANDTAIVTSPIAISPPDLENDNQPPNEEQNLNEQPQTETSTETAPQEPIPTQEVNADAIQMCKTRCPVTSEYNPLCASNNVTYANPNSLECAKACGEVDFTHKRSSSQLARHCENVTSLVDAFVFALQEHSTNPLSRDKKPKRIRERCEAQM